MLNVEQMAAAWEWLKTQGLGIAALSLYAWYSSVENKSFRDELRACNDQKYEVLVTIVSQNTIALQQFIQSQENGKESKKGK